MNDKMSKTKSKELIAFCVLVLLFILLLAASCNNMSGGKRSSNRRDSGSYSEDDYEPRWRVGVSDL